MPISPETVAFAVLCRAEGVLAEVIYDEVGLKPVHDFLSLVHSSSLPKAKRFLKTVLASHSAFDWQLKLSLADGNVPFFFSAAMANPGILIIGTKDPASSKPMPQALFQRTKRHAETLSPALQELASVRQAKARTRRRLRSGLSRLNRALEENSDPAGTSKTDAERQRNLIRTLAHDLRNPISGILTASQYLIEDASPLLEAEHVTLLRSIESSSEFILKLITDML
jgi:signal transduction histidine kinase